MIVRRVSAAPRVAIADARDPWPVRAGEWLFRRRSFLPFILIGVPLSGSAALPTTWALAAALIAAGIVIRFLGVAAAGPETRRRTRAVRRLVVHGPFAWTRNPIYVGNLLVWIGIALGTGDRRFACVAIAFFVACYSLIVRYEEAVLSSIFTERYAAYKRVTPRWLPRPPLAAAPVGKYDWRLAWRREWNTAVNILLAAAILAVKARWPIA
jgi:protein-S-isoprenylcysteine O-methyltransferase Ste14